MAVLNSYYDLSQSQLESDRLMRMRSITLDPVALRLYGEGVDGRLYTSSQVEMSALGRPVWRKVENVCASCGGNHGPGEFDENGKCQEEIKKENKRLHNLFFERRKVLKHWKR